ASLGLSLVRIQAAEENRLRIGAMSMIHNRIFDHDSQVVELSQYIPDVVSGILYAYGCQHITPDYQLDHVRLDTSRTVSLGLILTELVTNACKYAFADHPDPTLAVTCRRSGGSVEFMVADNGPGFDFSSVSDHSFDPSASLGLSLVRIQAEQLYGQFAFSHQGGTTFTMIFKDQPA
ncbi:sensor histidine kinase, partial [Persicitalea sp.]|uniref:sensor histidine kinase n=1 Tax=Persicitalea sp. TaxID=3100273 RepID=UPI0035940BF8